MLIAASARLFRLTQCAACASAALPRLQAIKQAGSRFSRPPIGPVGQYLNLEDSQ